MPVLPPTDDNLDRAAAALAAGDLVGLPTETVYGLAARALDADAVARIYAAKERPSFNPLIAHVADSPDPLGALIDQDLVDASRLTGTAERVTRRLLTLWPGPLTVVLPRGRALPDLTAAGLDTVAVRCPDHPVAQAVLRRVQGPLAAPSANRSGGISPTTAQDVQAELAPYVSMVLDGGPCQVGLESTVVHVDHAGTVTLLRPGSVSREQLAALVDAPIRLADSTDDERPRSPGMGSRHYAPRAPFRALPHRLPMLAGPARAAVAELTRDAAVVGVLCWTAADAERAPSALPHVEVHALALSQDGETHGAARRLFATLRALDALNADVLLAEPCPPTGVDGGLAHALRDRLGRATTPL